MTQPNDYVELKRKVARLEKQIEDMAKLQLETAQAMDGMSNVISTITDKLHEVFNHLKGDINK